MEQKRLEKKCDKCKKLMPFMGKICPGCGAKQMSPIVIALVVIGLIFVFWALFSGDKVTTPSPVIVENKIIVVEKDYNYQFIKENQQLTGACTRSEWVYSVPNSVLSEDIEPILHQIYRSRKYETDRTNISIYTQEALQNIENEIVEISIGFLNDGFNCNAPRKVEISNNWDLYDSFLGL